jgi:hypothetical protein
MKTKDKASILLLIFRRKGGEGMLTKVIDKNNSINYQKILSLLDLDESG